MVPFSVVIPLYNKQPHVARALRSVAAQTLAPREVLVVDDASTDGSMDVVERFADDNMRIFRRNIRGPGGYEARNLGIEQASSDWVAFLDADDAWRPDHLATLGHYLKEAPRRVGAATTCHVVHDGSGERKVPGFVERMMPHGTRHLDFDAFLELWIELEHCPVRTSSAAFKRSVLKHVGGFPEGRCERGGDKDLFLRACATTETIVVPRITTDSYVNAVNRVTATTGHDRAPCLCFSVDELLARAEPRRRKLLKDVHNLEVLRYATSAWRNGGLAGADFRTYHAARDPLGFAKLQVMRRVRRERVIPITRWLRRLRDRQPAPVR